MMHGEFFLACSNRSRTRLAPTPTNISTNSEPEIEKNGTPASPEMALAISVLPVPGGPTSSTPLGMRAPSEANFCGSLRNSTISASSSLDSSAPATSAKVTVGLSPVNTPRLTLTERHSLAVGALGLAHDHHKQAADEQQRQQRADNGEPAADIVRLRDLQLDFGERFRCDAELEQGGREVDAIFLLRNDGVFAIGRLHLELVAGYQDFADFAAID